MIAGFVIVAQTDPFDAYAGGYFNRLRLWFEIGDHEKAGSPQRSRINEDIRIIVKPGFKCSVDDDRVGFTQGDEPSVMVPD